MLPPATMIVFRMPDSGCRIQDANASDAELRVVPKSLGKAIGESIVIVQGTFLTGRDIQVKKTAR